MAKNSGWLVVIALFLLSFTLNYSIHLNYHLPVHMDEYDHLAIVKEMDRTGGQVNYDPYIVQKQFPQGRNVELGYDVFLLAIYQLTGLKEIFLPLVVPAIVTFLMALSAFVLVRWLVKSELAGLLSAVSVMLLHNNIALLGYWFMVPMALGLAFIPLFSYLFFKGLDSWADMAFLYLGLILITFSHAVYSVIFVPAFALYLFFNKTEIKKNWRKLLLGLGILIALTTWFVPWDLTDLNKTLALIINQLVWELWYLTKIYPIIEFLTPLAIALCLLALAYLLAPWAKAKKRYLGLYLEKLKSGKKILKPEESLQIHQPKLFLFFVLILFWARAYADQFEVCLLGPCRRTSPGLAVMVLLLAGIGLWLLVKGFRQFAESQLPEKTGRILKAAAFSALALFILIQLLSQPFTHAEGVYYFIDQDELMPLNWLGENTPEQAIVFALPWDSKAIHVIAERKVAGTALARLGQGAGELRTLNQFIDLDCQEKLAALQQAGAEFAYLKQVPIDCQGINKIYSGGGYHVYQESRP